MKKVLFKRLLTLMLTLALVFGSIPSYAKAAAGDEVTDPITSAMVTGSIKTIDKVTAEEKGVTVIGQVVYHYGNPYNGSDSLSSVILEDIIDGKIYGFQIYDTSNYASYKVGDVVTVTGDVTSYGGVLQMSKPEMKVVAAGKTPIPAQEVTIAELGKEYLSEYVKISGGTLGKYDGSGNTTITDATGTINIYKGMSLPSGVTTGSKVDLYACCSAYNDSYQLRTGSSADYAEPKAENLLKAGAKVVLYNASAKSVLGEEGNNSINPVAAELKDGKAVVENGGRIFTVEANGNYFRFKNETDGYLCANGTGNNAFYSQTASEEADWKLTANDEGYFFESRTAKYKDNSQYLEYYSDSFKTYSKYADSDAAIYTFALYATDDTVTEGIINKPAVALGKLAPAYTGNDYSLAFSVEALFGVKDMKITLGNTELEYKENNSNYTAVIPSELITGKSLKVSISGTDNKGMAIKSSATITVKDEPVFANEAPAEGTNTGKSLKPAISVDVSNFGTNPEVSMTVDGEKVNAVFANGKVTYTPSKALEEGRTNVTVTVKRADGVSATKAWNFVAGDATEELYFGQLHSHTQYSDGAGTLDDALSYISNIADSDNVDFVAVTDHSNYFDTTDNANPEDALYDMSAASVESQEIWSSYKDTVADFNEAQADKVVIAGFEMTWSGGPGHINTFNTPGIVSRNNSDLNNKTDDAGMRAYYDLLCQPEGEDSISQFNHPGATFGTFIDFSYWDAVLDTRIQLVEVGNGEGAINAGGYYPSYGYYTMALDKGWHVAPTNNQDNHKGRWGNANDARDVILTDDFSEEGIYEAIRNYKVYATEDKNLEIYYTLNDLPLGSTIEDVPEQLDINVLLSDPDATDTISRVEVIVNSGLAAYTWDDKAVLETGNLSCTLDPTYSYYYIRVIQGDGDIAVTAPVWVGETLKLGVSSVECATSTPVTGEELTLTTTLFNSEKSEATVKSITYTTADGTVIGTDSKGYTVPSKGIVGIDFNFTPDAAKVMDITSTVLVELAGIEYTYTMSLELDVLDAESLVYVGIDASHYNEYVSGNYKDSMGNLGELAAGYSVRTVELYDSEDLIAACSNDKYKAIILTAPSRRLAEAQENPATYTDKELAALKSFSQKGGTLILAGWSDYYENYDAIVSNPEIPHMAETQNTVLEALGSSLRISDDATHDASLNGGQTQRLYFSTYNFDSFLLDRVELDEEHPNDVMYTERYSQYGGATIHVVDKDGKATATIPESVTPIVYGHATTYSLDSDNDGGVSGDNAIKYEYADGDERLLVLASENIKWSDGTESLIIVAGAAFMSNFEVQATIADSGSEKNYSNYKMCENLMAYINPVTLTDIADVQAETETGIKYTIEGTVTSNASGYDKSTAFFDCIYVQDATGGICCFPVAGNYKIGDYVRITGTTDFYQGEMELQVSSITLLGEKTARASRTTAKQINDGSVLGSLVTLYGTVESFEKSNGLVQTIMVKDADGNVARVFIDGYISTDSEVKDLEKGTAIRVTGLASYDNTFNAPDGPFARIRVRNRADIACGEAAASAVAGGDGYTVIAGDYLRLIAEKLFGNESQWKAIYNANRDIIADPDKIRIGQVFIIPEIN